MSVYLNSSVNGSFLQCSGGVGWVTGRTCGPS